MRNNQRRLLGFIVGMSRSGTHWLAECLNTHADVVVIGETAFWGRKYVQPSDNGTYSHTHLDEVQRRHRGGCKTTQASLKLSGKNGIISNVVDEFKKEGVFPEPRHVFNRICDRIAQVEKKPFVIEKTPHHINWVERIDLAYPCAKFIIMMREPYSFMQSYKHQGDRKHDDAREAYRRVYHPIGCSLVYRGYVRSIRHAIAKLGDRALLVDYHDVKNQPQRVLERVQEFLGIPNKPILLPAVNSSFPSGVRTSLRADDIFWMNFVAGREIRQMGFELKRNHGNIYEVAMSFAQVPGWIVNVLLLMQKQVAGGLFSYLLRWLR